MIHRFGVDLIAAWSQDHIPRLAAALAYYLAFSIAPLIVIVVGVVDHLIALHPGMATEHETRARLVANLTASLGAQGASAVDSFVSAASTQRRTGRIAAIVGWTIILYGASGLFGALQDALNAIFEVQSTAVGWWAVVRDRLVSLVMIVVVLVLIGTAALAQSVLDHIAGIFPPDLPGLHLAARGCGIGLSVGILAILFGSLYRLLPDVKLSRRSILYGAAITAFLFLAGEWALRLYLERIATASAYGAAGSVVVFLLWLNYSAQIFLVGAEITKLLDRHWQLR